MARKLLVLMLVALLALSSSCSWRIQAVDQLIRAPKLSGEYASLQKAFDEYLLTQGGQTSILKPPLSGEFRSAYVLYDLNGNGMNDALIFYAHRNNPNVVRVNMLRHSSEDEWISIADYEGDGHEVHSVDFVDMNDDGLMEIVISWKFSDSNNKHLSVIGCTLNEQGRIEDAEYLLSAEQYTEKLVVDLDLDGNIELFIALIETAESRSLGKLLYYDADAGRVLPKPNGIIELDSRASAYRPLKYDVEKKEGGDACRIFIDTIVQQSPANMVTEIVVWDEAKKRLLSPTLSAENQTVSNDSLRTAKLEESQDIDGDGLLDIPTYSKLVDSEVLYSIAATTEDLYIVEWKTYTEDLFKSGLRYIDYDNGAFRFIVPSDFDTFSVFINATDNNRMEFFELDSEKNISGEPLFTLHSHDMIQWISLPASENKPEYIKTNKEQTFVYSCDIFPAGKRRGINTELLYDLILLL